MVMLTVFLVGLGIVNVRDRAAWVDPYDGVFWIDSERGLLAKDIDQNGPASLVGIRKGDVLVSINGRGISNLGEYFSLLDALGTNAAASYRIVTGMEERDVALELTGKALFSLADIFRTLLAFLHLGIGLFVAIRGSRFTRSYHFYLVCVAAFVVYLYSYTPKLGAVDFLVYACSVTAFLLLPVLFLHFCLRFPVVSPGVPSRVLMLYLPALALGLLHLFWMTGRLAGFGLPRDANSLQLLERVQLVYFCAGLVLSAAVLLRRQFRAQDLTTRQQMKWVSYGTLGGVIPFSLIYVIPWVLGAHPTLAMESSMLFLALLPLSFAYAVIHFRLLDVEVIVRRSTAYFLASTLLLALYLGFVLLLGKALESIAPGADFIAICIAALAIALLFAPLRNRIQARLDRIFYKEQFDDRASLLEFARTLSTEISLGPLSRSILQRLSKTFQVERVALFMADPMHPGFFRLVDEMGRQSADIEERFFKIEDLIDEAPEAAPLIQEQEGRLRRVHRRLQEEGLYYLQDLRLRGRRIGMIGIGRLRHGKHFSTEDLDLLAALAGYAAIALENAGLYRSIEMKALELERLKIYTENIIESVNVAIVALDFNGVVTSCNRTFEKLYGVQRDEIRGTAIEALFDPDVIESIHKATGLRRWELKSTSNIFKLYPPNRRGDGLIVNLGIIPLLDSSDVNSGCLIVMDDISAKVRLEDQLLQVEKLSSLGLLAAGVAHEVNTPITGISSYTQMLLKEIPESDQRRKVLEKIEAQTFRAAEIVNGLLNFARMNGSEFSDLDVNQLLQESLSLLDHQMKQSRIRVVTSFDHSLPPVYGNGGKLQQVFVNLFLNARDAMSSGGELDIRTSMNDTMVVVDIVDSGAGISEENIKCIYDPFFTTKSSTRGTGLGLAVTYGIIQDHGGRILVESAPGKGTHFTLKLPTRQAAAK